MNYSLLTVFLLMLLNISCLTEKKVPEYDVHYLSKHSITVDGLLDEDAWKKANQLKDFMLPWKDNTPQVTIFQALFDSNNLYFFFAAEDRNLVVRESIITEMDVAAEDRIEFYFSKDNTMEEYYCFEIDPLGRVLDYKASYYRKFDEKWNINGIQVATKVFSGNYQVEVVIPLISINEMGIESSKDFYVGLFRADFEQSVSGIDENWLSWINPGTPTPDFHVPVTLGRFHFVRTY